jgi:hypothetical protein
VKERLDAARAATKVSVGYPYMAANAVRSAGDDDRRCMKKITFFRCFSTVRPDPKLIISEMLSRMPADAFLTSGLRDTDGRNSPTGGNQALYGLALLLSSYRCADHLRRVGKLAFPFFLAVQLQ